MQGGCRVGVAEISLTHIHVRSRQSRRHRLALAAPDAPFGWVRLDGDLMATGGLKRRTVESQAALREMRGQMTDAGPVMEAAAAFLAVRPRSVDETRRRLGRLGYPDALVSQVVDRLIEMDYLDDTVFARAWVESRDRARPRGESALRRELALKGVPRVVVDEVLVERLQTYGGGDPNDTAALALLERRRASIEREGDPVRRRQRAYALLARNGFDFETCREASVMFLRAAD